MVEFKENIPFEQSRAKKNGILQPPCRDPGACFSKVPIINGPSKLLPFTLKIEDSIVLHLT